ncbi:MAG: LacI family transcriptional regulator [Clostridiales Family XIII bacterium]|jgi:LacI family transcriptional regulator|nr:LacI family transcriptional regulator [Clostridiales Family XIII bacterium]
MTKSSIHDVAKLAGVSTATVSHTINKTRFVSEDTKLRVQSAIDTLGYIPNVHARSLRTGRKKTIGFIVPDISNKFFASVIESVEEVVSEQKFHLIIANTRETKQRELAHLRYFASGVVDGLLLASTLGDYSECANIIPSSLPVVSVDRELNQAPYDSVTVNSFKSVHQGVLNLIGKGKKRIGFITGLPHLSTTIERLSAYEHAIIDGGLELDPSLITVGNSMENSAYICTKELLDAKCDAIVVSNGIMADDVIDYLNRKSIIIGTDVSLVCFYDYNKPAFRGMDIDIVEQPVVELGQQAGKRILNKIKHPDAAHQNIILSSNYIQNAEL